MKNLYKASNIINYFLFIIVYIILFRFYLTEYNNIITVLLFSTIFSLIVTIILSLPIKYFISKMDKSYILDYDKDQYNKVIINFTKNHIAGTPYFKSIPLKNQYFELYDDKIIIYPTNKEIYFDKINQIRIYNYLKYFAEILHENVKYNFQLTKYVGGIGSFDILQNYKGAALGYLLRYLGFSIQRNGDNAGTIGIYVYKK